MFHITFTPEAINDPRQFCKYDQQHIVAAIETQLLYQPAHEMRHQKRLRPNALVEWELHVQTFRVFYDVDVAQNVVKIAAVGSKQSNTLFIHGEGYEL
jgi:mRNA-degrading endonuclease RelE of RelBE toxin-antitoxin system